MSAQMSVEKARFNMIEQQIRPADVLDAAVIGALFRARREQFVPQAARALAHADTAVPLGHGEFMLTPQQEARMLVALHLQAGDKVLEVGTGSGYTAALLGMLAGQVSSVEQRADFVAAARARLQAAGVDNVAVHLGDGLLGLPGDAPFDAIVISGALQVLPETLLDQLKVGGRLVAVIGRAPTMQVLRVTRRGPDAWQHEVLFETVAPYLREAAPSRFSF